MAQRPLTAADKQRLAKQVGSDLAKTNGKKRYYTVEEIKAAARRQNIPDGWDCWALSLYSSASDFDTYHAAIGESCNYASMHYAMVMALSHDTSMPDLLQEGMSSSTDSSWFEVFLDFLSNIELPDFDFFDSSS